ncbi:c-type cytochrome [Paenirhodobacter sp.]|uniref:c-type cytochrome n=1 Tax=Paenirhodobacter sp. TaxID=1965326 RepID=UPI003B3F6A47
MIDGRTFRACHTCHGRDGRGGNEGAAPAIVADRTGASVDAHGMQLALEQRRRPDGSILSALMPAYSLSPEVLSELTAYLDRLPAEQRTGITARSIRLAVPFGAGGEDRASAYAATLRAGLAEALGPQGAYGRVPEVEAVKVAPGTCPPGLTGAAAVIGLGPELDPLRPCLAARAVPVLYPIYPLVSAPGDMGLTCTLLPGWAQIARDLVAALKAAGIEAVMVPHRDHPLLPLLEDERAVDPHLRILTPDQPVPDAASTVFLQIGAAGPGRPGIRPLLLPEGILRKDLEAAAAQDGFVLVYGTDILSEAVGSGRPLIEAYALTSARNIAAAILHAGRNLTRTGLLQATDCLTGRGESTTELIRIGPLAGKAWPE